MKNNEGFFDSCAWKEWKVRVKNFYENNFFESPLFVSKSYDNRPYILAKLFESNIIGFLDRGANVLKAVNLQNDFSSKLNPCYLTQVARADDIFSWHIQSKR